MQIVEVGQPPGCFLSGESRNDHFGVYGQGGRFGLFQTHIEIIDYH